MNFKENGFLLLEAMLSVTLLAGGLVLIFLSFSMSKNLLNQSRDMFEETLLLQKTAAELEETGHIVPGAGATRSKDERYQINVTAQPLEAEALQKGFLECFPVEKRDKGIFLEIYFFKKEK